jgi:hypothetical protein
LIPQNFLLLFFFAVTFLFVGKTVRISAQTDTPMPTPDPNQQTSSISECADNNIKVADCPTYLQNKLTQLAGQEQTLDTQIGVMDGQLDPVERNRLQTDFEVLAAPVHGGVAARPLSPGRVAIDDSLFKGYLANVPAADWRGRYRAAVWLGCVALGTGRALEEMKTLKNLLINMW